MPKYFSINEARKQLDVLIDEANAGETIHVTRDGDSVAVILPYGAYETLVKEPEQFGDGLEAFRQRHRIEELDIDPDRIFDCRDGSFGR